MQRRLPLVVEQLEDQRADHMGNAWPDAQHLSLSFAPDQTQVIDQSSTLFKTLNAQFKTTNPAAWEQVILRAFKPGL